MEFVLVVLVAIIAALLWRLVSALERIEDEIGAARQGPGTDSHSEDAEQL